MVNEGTMDREEFIQTERQNRDFPLWTSSWIFSHGLRNRAFSNRCLDTTFAFFGQPAVVEMARRGADGLRCQVRQRGAGRALEMSRGREGARLEARFGVGRICRSGCLGFEFG